MATATKDIERVVRKVLNEEYGETAEATLKAIQQLSTLLTEQVIPNLPGGEDDEAGSEPEDEEDDAVVMSAFDDERPAHRRSKPTGDEGEGEDVGEGEDDQPDRDIPEPVTEAFEELYNALSPEQATALASLFTAVGSELGEGADGEPGASAY